MKNLMVYLNPLGFDPESTNLVKLQIDNCFELGWNKEDIILVTNFPYEYKGIKAWQINDGYCDHKPTASKVVGLIPLFDIGFFGKDIYWCHDLDAYQQYPITEEELGLENLDAGFCDYGRSLQWQMGSFFFKKTAEDIFRENVARIEPGKHDEHTMMELTDNNIVNVNNRIKRMNITYDFGMRRIDLCYEKAIKPIKILHFHPHNPIINTLKRAMYGKNSIGKPLMTERLIKLFHKYGYK